MIVILLLFRIGADNSVTIGTFRKRGQADDDEGMAEPCIKHSSQASEQVSLCCMKNGSLKLLETVSHC